jgi:hypothetical protein
MNNTFKIIEDITLDFDMGQLFIMQVKCKNHGIIIDSRSCRIGVRSVKNRRTGDLVIGEIIKSLSKYNNLKSVLDVLDIAFKTDTLKQFMFIVNMLNKHVQFNDVWKTKQVYGCLTHPLLTDLIYEDSSFNRSIAITFPGYTAPLGHFRAIDDSEDSLFLFELNVT